MPQERDFDALVAFVDARQLVPHAWGRSNGNDCVGFALGAVEAQTGVRVAPDLDWKSRAGALRLLKRFGSLEAALDAYFERVPCALASRGDIAGVPDDEFGLHPMIVEGRMLVSPGQRGNGRAKRSAMTVAWSAVRVKHV